MGTPADLTFDLTLPRRPGLDDVGGAAKADDIAYPPDPLTMATAKDINQWSKLLVALGKVAPMAILSVRFSAGTPAVYKVTSMCSGIVLSSFTVVDNGAGDTSVTWPANTFPMAVADAGAKVTGATPAMIAAESITNGARVRSKSDTGSAVDVNFNLEIY